MNFKIDTKEKFLTFTILEPELSANMTAELNKLLLSVLKNETSNVVLKMDEVKQTDLPAAETILAIQQHFYDESSSFVICCLQKNVEQFLDESGVLKDMNTTPTESEAWDIIQMEEIERELMDEEE